MMPGCCGGRCLGNVQTGKCIGRHMALIFLRFLLGLCTKTTQNERTVWMLILPDRSETHFVNYFTTVTGIGFGGVWCRCGTSFIFVHISRIYR
jgi:hypothetical protein